MTDRGSPGPGDGSAAAQGWPGAKYRRRMRARSAASIIGRPRGRAAGPGQGGRVGPGSRGPRGAPRVRWRRRTSGTWRTWPCAGARPQRWQRGRMGSGSTCGDRVTGACGAAAAGDNVNAGTGSSPLARDATCVDSGAGTGTSTRRAGLGTTPSSTRSAATPRPGSSSTGRSRPDPAHHPQWMWSLWPAGSLLGPNTSIAPSSRHAAMNERAAALSPWMRTPLTSSMSNARPW